MRWAASRRAMRRCSPAFRGIAAIGASSPDVLQIHMQEDRIQLELAARH